MNQHETHWLRISFSFECWTFKTKSLRKYMINALVPGETSNWWLNNFVSETQLAPTHCQHAFDATDNDTELTFLRQKTKNVN